MTIPGLPVPALLDEEARAQALRRWDGRVKPPGSLGRLEALGAQLAAISGRCPPPPPRRPAVAVFAADHGVVASGVSAWPREVTAAMVAMVVAGGAAIDVLAAEVGARILVVDVGVADDLAAVGPGVAGLRELVRAKVRPGTADLAGGPAMAPADVDAALTVGAATAARLVREGADCLVTGEVGIANTTAAAAVIAALTASPAAACVGRGAGATDASLARKVAVVAAALDRLGAAAAADRPAWARRVLAAVGGLEIAAVAGFCLGGAAAGVPVVVDGVVTLSGLLAACELRTGVAGHVVAGHRSPEPGATIALGHLGLEPVLDLGMRLGEGTGACLAVPVLRAAAALLGAMAALDDVVGPAR